VAGAEVTVRDREGIVVFAGKTDERGELRGIPVVTVRHEQCTADPRKIRTDQRGPFRVTAQIEGKAASRETALRDEGEIRLRLPHP
jgi:hypothetical protein